MHRHAQIKEEAHAGQDGRSSAAGRRGGGWGVGAFRGHASNQGRCIVPHTHPTASLQIAYTMHNHTNPAYIYTQSNKHRDKVSKFTGLRLHKRV